MSEHHVYGIEPYWGCTCGTTGTRTEMDRHLYEAGAATAPDEVTKLRQQVAELEQRVQTEIDWQHKLIARASEEQSRDHRRHEHDLAIIFAQMSRWQRIGRRAEQLAKGRKTIRVAELEVD